eukprot:TRINITY_DN6057_c1_g1_i1.p1 TRINITY_DN6057_c1_g1~~TRINITY_DN6057_c1_g1_i1.p1  ORF type:complete len:1829 (-),score=382.79 TRINITY_DN6057_c1_g1_i1:24-5072(-)
MSGGICVNIVRPCDAACGSNAWCESAGAADSRKCTCYPGYYYASSPASLNEPSKTYAFSTTAENCVEIDYCNSAFSAAGHVGCEPTVGGATAGFCWKATNGRVCSCPVGEKISGTTNTQSASYSLSTAFPGCEDIKECDLYGSVPHGTCNDTIAKNSRTITCDAGYWASGRSQIAPSPAITLVGYETFAGCLQIDTCAVYGYGALSSSSCVSGFNTRTITCPGGQILELHGSEPFPGCTYNPCETKNGGCEGTCSFTEAGDVICRCLMNSVLDADNKTCSCLSGYKKIGSAVCSDINECFEVSGGCGPNSACATPEVNMRRCQCLPGYHFKTSLPPMYNIVGNVAWDSRNDCTQDDYCSPSYGCGTAVYNSKAVTCTNVMNGRYCTCPDGFYVKGSTGRTSPLLTVGTNFSGCDDSSKCNYYAESPLPPTGKFGCGTGLDGVQCSVETSGRTCTCPPGYFINETKRQSDLFVTGAVFPGCYDFNECSISNPCGELGECSTPTLGERKCTCPHGYHFGSQGNSGLTAAQLSASITLRGEEEWNPADNCVENKFCDYNFDSPPSGKFGCGNETYAEQAVGCTETITGRQCSCPSGFYIAGVGTQTADLPPSLVFPGCIQKDVCDHNFGARAGDYGCGTSLYNALPVTCTVGIDRRTCTCPPGFHVFESLQNSVEILAGTSFQGCRDIQECSKGCGSGAQCSEPEYNLRHCKCNQGFHPPSYGDENLTPEQIQFRTLIITGNTDWNPADECVANDHCNINFDFPSSGGYGCGIDTYAGASVSCSSSTQGRTCVCPPGFWAVGANKSASILVASGSRFSGCYDIDECEVFGYDSELSNCTTPTLGSRTVTCAPGYYAQVKTEGSSTLYKRDIVLEGSAEFNGCLDFNECMYGCPDPNRVTVACSDSSSTQQLVPANSRKCTCPAGYNVYNYTGQSSVVLVGPTSFTGCVDCSACPFNSYQTEPCNATHGRLCEECPPCPAGFYVKKPCTSTEPVVFERCSVCPDGYYASTPCSAEHDTICTLCNDPCQSPLIEGVSCTPETNRVCWETRTPTCEGGCGKGRCVDYNVCECPFDTGYYGTNCEHNCHLTCLKHAGICETSVQGRTWWCTCPPQWFPSVDSKRCYPADTDTPRCLWSEWSEWSQCTGCGGTKTREAELIISESDASCGRTYPEYDVCSSNCTISYENAQRVRDRTAENSGAYHAMNVALFWRGEIAKIISTKYNLTLVLEADIDGDAFNEQFTMSFVDSELYLTLRYSLDSKRSLQQYLTDPAIESSEMCPPEERVEAAAEEVRNITLTFMKEVLETPDDAIHWNTSGCKLSVKIDSPPELVIWPIFGGVVGGMSGIILILCLIFLWYKTRPMDLSILPPPVRWQYEQYIANSTGWVKDPSQRFYKKLLSTGSEEYEKMSELFYGHLEAFQKLEIAEAYAIFNPTLLTSFINHRQIITSRMTDSPEIFAKEDWKSSKMSSEKQMVFDKYKKRCADMGWNDDLAVPILVTCHGTDFNVAMAIASTGFAALSSLDAGWFGSGVYFTTYAMYACPYFSGRKDPAVLLSFVTMGNVFPVTEDQMGEDSLIGKVLKAGYTGHYVGVQATGNVPEYGKVPLDEIGFLYDEIVVSQEPQISPVYVLRIATGNLQKIMKQWEREDLKRKGKTGRDGDSNSNGRGEDRKRGKSREKRKATKGKEEEI